MVFNIAVIYGSVRSNRQGIKAAKFVVNKLKERKHKVTLVDPKEFKLPLLNKMYKEYKKGTAPKNLEKLAKILKNADGYVLVTAEYNHSIPAALKNILDYFLEEYAFKPSAIVSYSTGPFGGVIGGNKLRSITAELGMISIPTSLPISKVHTSFDKNGKALDEAYERRIKRFISEFEWYLGALKKARKK